MLFRSVRGRRTISQETIAHNGNTLKVYPSLQCYVFDRQIGHRDHLRRFSWHQLDHLRGHSLFLGINHPLFGTINSPLPEPGQALPVWRTNCVYLAHDRLHNDAEDIHDTSYWVRLHVGGVQPQNSIGGYIEFNEEAIDMTQTAMWLVPRLPL